jgi:hypothetical protein
VGGRVSDSKGHSSLLWLRGTFVHKLRCFCSQVPEPKEEGSAHLAVPGVYFTCPLTGATLRRDQRDAHIKEAILSVSGQALQGVPHRAWTPL